MSKIPEDILLDCAAGTAPAAVALFAAVHGALSPETRATTRRLEAIGGALLDGVAPAPMRADARARALAALDAPDRDAPPDWEAPLARLVAGAADGADGLVWRSLIRGVDEVTLIPSESGRFRARLLRIAPGVAIPHHGHGGEEMTLVLAGGYGDETGHYDRGAAQFADAGTTHQPRADMGGPCICLVVSDAPIRPTGRITRLLNLWYRS